MVTTIDAAGRIVIPKPIRDAIGLAAGTELEVRVVDGRLELEPAPLPVTLERRRGLVVAVPKQRVRPLSAAEVDATRDAIRSSRGGVFDARTRIRDGRGR
jgi:AbrB family looped-hinge helix DNA binding protein